MKKAVPNPKANKNILIITYVIVILFISLIGYFGYFLQVKSESVINNSYNGRLDRFSDRIVRGAIESSDGEILARTVIDADGNEKREYPYGNLFAHAIGYSEKGKTGVEAIGNFYLLSSHVNLIEQIVKQLGEEKNPGDTVITTFDTELQKTAYDALGDRRGAVVVIQPDTGKILAMVSKPDYDPNTISSEWEQLINDESGAAKLLNRATQGLYPPGSTFKIFTALEYIREHPDDYENYTFSCSGAYKKDDYVIKCFHNTVHGEQNLESAFANSCNGAFANLGLSLDKAGMKQLADQLLFNTDLPLAFPHSKSSYVLGSDAGVWDVLQTSIGQGQTQITPIHNAMIVSAIANGGTLMKPYCIDHIENVGNETIKKFTPTAFGSIMSAQQSSDLTKLMTKVVTEGTASALKTDQYTAAGKTGSAEFSADKETHAWFVGFAPVDKPQLAVSVIVEEGGSGGKTAAPIARKIFDTWFSKQH